MMICDWQNFALIKLLVAVAIPAAMLFPSLAMAEEEAVEVHDSGDPPMNCLLFFDDWMLEARQGLDRMQGQPVLRADVSPELPEHLSRLDEVGAAASLFFDERVGRYVMYVDCWTADPDSTRFSVRVESDDPLEWPDLRGERAAEVPPSLR